MLSHIHQQFLIVEVVRGQFLIGVVVPVGGEQGGLLEDAGHFGVGDLLGGGHGGLGGLELGVVVVAELSGTDGSEVVDLVFVGTVGSRIREGGYSLEE